MEPTYPTGALKNKPDYRDIPLLVVQGPAPYPAKHITDISMLPVEDQEPLGICVGCAEGKIKQYNLFKQTGKIVDISERYIYSLARIYAGQNLFDSEGTYPREAAKVTVNSGCPTAKTVVENRDLPHAEYATLEITEAMIDDGQPNKNEGYAVVDNQPQLIAQAIYKNSVMSATMQVGRWNTMPVRPTPDRWRGLHRIIFFGYEYVNGKLKIHGRNSWGNDWGNNGNFWFWYDEYAPYLSDLMVYTDIPADLIVDARKKTKRPEYDFKIDLVFGMDRNYDVRMLQDCLKYEGLLSAGALSDGLYGPKTAAAVLAFQLRYALGFSFMLSFGGGRTVGSKMRELLNKLYAKQSMETSKLRQWALAIQAHEGYFAPGQNKSYPNGTRAWRNKNPGNIRYIGRFQALSIGQDDKGFCKFETYEKGMAALELLLTRAAQGLSSVYPPGCTLAKFFSIYAPASDGNNVDAYVNVVAKKLGVDPGIPIKELV